MNMGNASLNSTQILGKPLSGNFTMVLLNAPLDSKFSSIFGERELKAFLGSSGKAFGCESFGCLDVYSKFGNGVTSLDFEKEESQDIYGIFLEGSNLEMTKFSWELNSSFSELEEIPLEIKIGDSLTWKYVVPLEDSENVREVTHGCYDPSAPSKTKVFLDTKGYCETVVLNESFSYFLGAYLEGSSPISTTFSLKNNTGILYECIKAISSAEYGSPVGCFLDPFEVPVKQGTYEVCISSAEEDSGYTLLSETKSPICGKYGVSGQNTADYSLFVKTPLYSSNNGKIIFTEEFYDSVLSEVNKYLLLRYNHDCSKGCVVPIIFDRRNSSLFLENIDFKFSTSSGLRGDSKVYPALGSSPKINISSNFSVDSFNWTVEIPGNYSFYVDLTGGGTKSTFFLGNFSVFSEDVHDEIPHIKDFYPQNPPAGMEVMFTVISDPFSKLKWNFGDGSPTIESNESSVKHVYKNLSNGTNVTITLIRENHTVNKTFLINVTSPEDYLNSTFSLKKERVENLTQFIDTLPILVEEYISNFLNLIEIKNRLNILEMEKVNASGSQDFLDVMNKLNGIEVPYSFELYETFSGSFGQQIGDINPSVAAKVSSKNGSSFEEYRSSIHAWQLRFVDATTVRNRYRIVKENGGQEDILTYYQIGINSSSNETLYFFINKPSSDLFRNEVWNIVDAGKEYTVVGLSEGFEGYLYFYYKDSSNLKMFFSPSLDLLEESLEISRDCLVDGICDRDFGETYKNCPQDCKNYSRIILLILLSIVIFLVVYTFVQLWYVKSYEKFLFKDRSFVFNLMAYINNSKLSAISTEKIRESLLSNGWRNEQVTYAIKKTEGKNTGMFEIIPLSKFVAMAEMSKAKKRKGSPTPVPRNKVRV